MASGDSGSIEAAPSGSGSSADLRARLTADVDALDVEIREIDLLISQARTEAERHEAKRTQATDRIAALGETAPAADLATLNAQLVTLTRRASMMQSQVEVLEGKKKTLLRFREALAGIAGAGDLTGLGEPGSVEPAEASHGAENGAAAGAAPAPMSRIVLAAQEDLRREIARAMHDGPAQSLTNIVLQAQIVERLVARDPEMARSEVRQLVGMVQQTLEATKTFIFDVRPMVLDDLGLVPTLRRAARERGRRASVPVEFESVGQDRRLSMDLESNLFRMLDEAMAAYLGEGPDRVTLRLDWLGDRLDAVVAATRGRTAAMDEADREVEATSSAKPSGKDLPPALASMMADRREAAEAAAVAARDAAIVGLPASAWREIQGRAATLGIQAELREGGGELRIGAELSGQDAGSAPEGTDAASGGPGAADG